MFSLAMATLINVIGNCYPECQEQWDMVGSNGFEVTFRAQEKAVLGVLLDPLWEWSKSDQEKFVVGLVVGSGILSTFKT